MENKKGKAEWNHWNPDKRLSYMGYLKVKAGAKKRWTPEARKKNSESHKGKKQTLEWIRKREETKRKNYFEADPFVKRKATKQHLINKANAARAVWEKKKAEKAAATQEMVEANG